MHVCLFDIDGTLLHTGGAGQSAMEAALAADFGVTQPITGIPTAGRTDYAITRDIFEFYGFETAPETIGRFIEAYLRRLPEHLAERDGLVLPGIDALLEQLHPRDDIVLGLLTGNYREGARLKLEHYGLDEYFVLGGYGDDHEDRCDVARAALAAVHDFFGAAEGNGQARSRTVDLERLWVIGDTPSDVRCGRVIGAKVVAVGTGLFPLDQLEAERPDHLFADFSDPETLLELLT